MHIISITERTDRQAVRHRLMTLKPLLETHGHHVEVRLFPRRFWPRLKLWWSLGDADAVVVQRVLPSRLHLHMLRRFARRLIFDFDEAVYCRNTYSSKKNENDVLRQRFADMLFIADHVVAGNEYLKQEAAAFIDHSRIDVIPTCIDVDSYSVTPRSPKKDGVRLVWIGTAQALQSIERRRPLIDTLAEHVPGIQCKVICNRAPIFKKMPVVHVPWAVETEAQELADGDIGMSWQSEDRASIGDCGVNVLQYMAAGLPVVANPVGVQSQMVRHGETGFLAKSPQEWIQAIKKLADDPMLRQRMGLAGRRRAERFFSLERGLNDWLACLQPNRLTILQPLAA